MIMHVRPSAKYSSYAKNDYSFELPVKSHWINRPASQKGKWIGDKPSDNCDDLTDEYMTKQAFWLNKDYMYRQVAELYPVIS